MDGSGGCCIARYAGGAYDMSKVDRIMLKFRPIAPKPTADGSVSGSSKPPQKAEVPARTGRWKRRYVKDSKKSRSGSSSTARKRKGSSSSEENESKRRTVSGGEVVTLPLLSDSSVGVVKKPERNAPIWLNFGSHGSTAEYGGDRSAVMLPKPVVGSWVKVECVTDTWVEGYGLGRTDEEKLMNLERDTCPGFVSDGSNRVRWANKAYREIVSDQGGATEGEVVVWLVMNETVRLPENKTTAAFTCRVRVIRCGKEKISLVLPCDVWRMDGGGFAWRLDTKAALSLGR